MALRSQMVSNVAIAFPGQGSQRVGMGQALVERFQVAAAVFDRASDVTGNDIRSLCFSNPEGLLGKTDYTQLAVFVVSWAAWEVLRDSMDGEFTPTAFLGHSLGEYTALVAASAIEFDDALHLVARRGQAMAEAGRTRPGGMVAIVGTELERVENLCDLVRTAVGSTIDIANINCPGQTVVAGEVGALEEFVRLCKEKRVGRTVRLRVSVAPHTSLMKEVSDELRLSLKDVAIHDPAIPVVGNVRAAWLETAEDVRSELALQVISPVRWSESVQKVASIGVETLAEVGPGTVLTGLVKRIAPTLSVVFFGDDPNTSNKVREALSRP